MARKLCVEYAGAIYPVRQQMVHMEQPPARAALALPSYTRRVISRGEPREIADASPATASLTISLHHVSGPRSQLSHGQSENPGARLCSSRAAAGLRHSRAPFSDRLSRGDPCAESAAVAEFWMAINIKCILDSGDIS